MTRQTAGDGHSVVDAILADALNIYDVIVWAEKAGHNIITQRKETDGTVRVLIKPGAVEPNGFQATA